MNLQETKNSIHQYIETIKGFDLTKLYSEGINVER
jgi:hypothetical protein